MTNTENVMEQLSKMANSGSLSTKESVEDAVRFMLKEHRTLQAGIVRFLAKVLREYGRIATENQAIDLRNKAAVEYCANLPEVLIPFI